MTVLGRLLRWCYAQSIRLYPVDFRATLVVEMRAVFREALEDQNLLGLLLLCGRELRDLPGSILRAPLQGKKELLWNFGEHRFSS